MQTLDRVSVLILVPLTDNIADMKQLVTSSCDKGVQQVAVRTSCVDAIVLV